MGKRITNYISDRFNEKNERQYITKVLNLQTRKRKYDLGMIR